MKLTQMPIKLFTKKLQGTLDQQEERKFRDYMINDPDALHNFELVQHIWKEAENAKVFDQINTSSDWDNVRGQIISRYEVRSTRIHWESYILRIAALLILTGGISLGLYKLLVVHHTSSSSDITGFTADNNIKEVLLPDGSTVTLNRGASLTYNESFGTKSREVKLKGDAYFSVMPDADLPFKVFTGESVVEVTGTKFSVYKINGEVHVSVLSGRVLLSSADILKKKISISANQSGYLTADNDLKVENGVSPNILSWKTGHLEFDQTPIDSALIDIAHHFNRELVFENRLNDKITAQFQNQPLREILQELTLVAGLNFDTTGTALIVRK